MQENKIFTTDNNLAILTPDGVKIKNLLDNCFLTWAEAIKADNMIFPPLVKIADLNQIEYFRNFPHLSILTSSLEETILERENNQAKDNIAKTYLTDSIYALPSAACYNIFFYLKNTTIQETRHISTIAQCFRQEKYYQGLERLLSYTLREIVSLGSDENIKLQIAKYKQQVLDFALAIELPITIQTANDPFYNSQDKRAKMQKLFRLKEEFIFNDRLALGSINFHLNFFGEKCNIKASDRSLVFSCCLGMGLERWIHALTQQFDNNVKTICERLEKYLK